MPTSEGSYAEVEGRVVDKNEYIGFFQQESLLSNGEIALHIAQIAQYRLEAHEGHLAVVLIDPATGLTHAVTAQSGKLRGGIDISNGTHQICCVLVAGGFTCKKEISHNLSIKN